MNKNVIKESHNTDSNNSEIPWQFERDELQVQCDIIQKLRDPKTFPNFVPLDDVFLHVHNFISTLLLGTYRKNEIEEIINYLCLATENIIYWGLNFSVEKIIDQLNDLDSLSHIYKSLNKILGMEDSYSSFHITYKKSVPPKTKLWEGCSLTGSLPKLSLFFINFFGKVGGFDFILNLLLSK